MAESSIQKTASQEPTVTQAQKDILDQLLNPEVQQSLTVLVDSLPKIAELVTILNKVYDFSQSVATDKVLMNDFKGGFQEFIDPVADKAKGIAQTVIEAKDRAEESNETIGLFGLLRLMKDPQAQKLFRFLHAFLAVSEERNKQQHN
ncbi:DUF1641 domain-containing protein [Heyndrickxia ginsengihumi]|uniref:DUF1641 domain-containing protein n=1 Tax=Heyndrickxia ginsengihumi TaxID=363870 RepID=A0A0A6XZE3_9BACI|nr:DUF1641 domain-containing protein [Heyndrickxia ginsengihumi]KHD85477.1 hypothetical protein NG54_08845 [Heyndrickxia ginsengihumi]MBE6183182.1 DUF1641 domain-containing protein [Bacillus sp. (in: firmicutes)]MCM3023854.1 DUF1641 domain-containing protein [Heyndrickxia ginsengihumi]NEY20725.1 DUF1641 domain-containing protein [Heyndrickxia ginsengihumi]